MFLKIMAFIIIILLMLISLWNSCDFLGTAVYGNWWKGLLEMGAMELSLLFLIFGISIRVRQNKSLLIYTIAEMYVLIAISVANYFQLMETFAGSQIAWHRLNKGIEWPVISLLRKIADFKTGTIL